MEGDGSVGQDFAAWRIEVDEADSRAVPERGSGAGDGGAGVAKDVEVTRERNGATGIAEWSGGAVEAGVFDEGGEVAAGAVGLDEFLVDATSGNGSVGNQNLFRYDSTLRASLGGGAEVVAAVNALPMPKSSAL